MAEPPTGFAEANKKPDLSGIAMKTPLNYLEERFGEEALDRFLSETGMDREYFEVHNNWISFAYAHKIFRKIVELANDEEVCLDVGRCTVSRKGLARPYGSR